jgi:hypothetical protein
LTFNRPCCVGRIRGSLPWPVATVKRTVLFKPLSPLRLFNAELRHNKKRIQFERYIYAESSSTDRRLRRVSWMGSATLRTL